MAKTLSRESSNGYTCTIQPKIEGRKRPPAVWQASCVAIEPFNPNFVQSALRNCARGGMQRLVCRCHMATLSGTRALSCSSVARLGMVYIAPTNSYPLEVLRYSKEVGRAGSNVNAST